VIERFDLPWLGGASERYFRGIRPDVDELPWGTLEPARYPPLLLDRARVSWTEAAWNEYCTAAAKAQLVSALLAARAPVDFVGMASDFIADEVLHIELTSRIAMELGGGAPYEVDFAHLELPTAPGLSPLQRANELVVRIWRVGEAFSVPMLGGCKKSAAHPLTRAVLDRIVRDEAPHGAFGWLYLDWIGDDLPASERKRLAKVAMKTLRQFQPYWRRLRSRVVDSITTEGFQIAHVRELGWMESQEYAAGAREAVRNCVVRPLARYGIVLPEAEVDALLADTSA
jgi:hypothetical protein